MKIVIAGDWIWYQYEEAFSKALNELGHQIIPFKISKYFKGFLGQKIRAIPITGKTLFYINYFLKDLVKKEKPNILICWRCTHILPFTIKAINEMGILTSSYNNDDPFGPSVHGNVPWHHHFLWFWYLRGLKYYKRNYFYRKINVDEAIAKGALHADILKPYFIPWKDRPIELNEEEKIRFKCDVVFAGHYEPDNRVNDLRALVRSGLSVKLFGDHYWTPKVLGDLYQYFAPIIPVYNDEYIKALCGSKVCLVFLSKMNRDTYSRRCFEVLACGRVLLVERTNDLCNMFVEDKESCYFSNTEELVCKANWLVKNTEIAKSIGQSGMKRVWDDRHDVKSRAKEFINALNIN